MAAGDDRRGGAAGSTGCRCALRHNPPPVWKLQASRTGSPPRSRSWTFRLRRCAATLRRTSAPPPQVDALIVTAMDAILSGGRQIARMRMLNLIAAAAVFTAMRRVIAGTRAPEAIVSRIGERLYLALFSVSTIARSGMAGTRLCGRPFGSANSRLFELGIDLRPAQLGSAACGDCPDRNRSLDAQSDDLDVRRAGSAQGAGRGNTARHPSSIPVGRRHLRHRSHAGAGRHRKLDPVRDLGLRRVDRNGEHRRQTQSRVRRSMGRFRRRTSNLPFAAIVSGRQPFRPGEIGWLRFSVAAGAFTLLAIAHPFLFGGSVLR